MKRWLFLLTHMVEALIVLGVVYFEPTYCVRGVLWREAFFDGKPTSYWRDELHRWEVSSDPGYGWMGDRRTVYRRNPPQLEQLRNHWIHERGPIVNSNEPLTTAEILAQEFEWISQSTLGPRILHGDAEAIPVLQELLDDPSPKIRLFAQIGLGKNPKIPGDE